VSERTVVHLLRHGEVDNPTGILYGRLPGFHLSELGREMAERIALVLGDRDIVHVVTSPLERAVETGAPVADKLGLTPALDDRLIESTNVFEGKTFGVGDGSLKRPAQWRYLVNPFTPSWGEPYVEVVERMRAAVETARDAARGHEALAVSHQLPIWILRCALEHRRLWHDPRKRQCSLASLTSVVFDGDSVVGVEYDEPARDLLPTRSAKKFTAGA
jgi:broad specificity phosphatase PhoE